MSVLVTVVSFTPTCFSSHLIVTGTDPGGGDAHHVLQYVYNGHVVNLPQDVASFVQSLPRLPSELDVIVVRKEGANQSHRDFRVRRAVVHRALQWLVTQRCGKRIDWMTKTHTHLHTHEKTTVTFAAHE